MDRYHGMVFGRRVDGVGVGDCPLSSGTKAVAYHF